MLKSLTFALIATAGIAQAQGLTVTFADGAPKDRFELINEGCALQDVAIAIDLTDTPAGLIFDVTASGAGVEVFQPVEVTAGTMNVSAITDGAQQLQLTVPSFPSDTTYSLTADLDDTVSNRQITVSGSEMLGARVLLTAGEVQAVAPFDANGRAMIDLANLGFGCPSA